MKNRQKINASCWVFGKYVYTSAIIPRCDKCLNNYKILNEIEKSNNKN